MLSHPLLLKADAKTGPRLLFSQPQMMAAAVVVLPVPGGPWIKLKRLGEELLEPVEKKTVFALWIYGIVYHIMPIASIL